MTRPKVDPANRQRTAQACDSCKRRKQKCNGLKPCQTCEKRNLSCVYGASENAEDELTPTPKRRMIDPAPSSAVPSPDHERSESATVSKKTDWASSGGQQLPVNDMQTRNCLNTHMTADQFARTLASTRPNEQRPVHKRAVSSMAHSPASTGDGHDEDVIFHSERMLQDTTGRLLYIGDSATLSFLQVLRIQIDHHAGPSPFTTDPRRHMIVETTTTLPPQIRDTHLLPDKRTASILVESYFINVSGLIEVCHRKSFLANLDSCYTDPLNVDPSWLCSLYLIFAIGLVMAAPIPGSEEDILVRKLRSEPIDRAERFFSDAKNLKDPSAGFEDADFWSVQVLTLMSVYMLAVSKRNAAYAYFGMAVRSAFALGLHREEAMVFFNGTEQSTRRNLWRSLFVLDRFLAASLGRPTSIRESDCSGTTLQSGEKPPFPQAPFPTAANSSFTSSTALGLEASVRSCHVIGVILEKVYARRKISTKLAQEIAESCKGWLNSLDTSLHHSHATTAEPSQGIAILHVNLLYCHSIILLTRPFFFALMAKVLRDSVLQLKKHPSRWDRFAEACVAASCHTIVLCQKALEGGYLPHRNPFALYFLFSAALIILASEFSALYSVDNPGGPAMMNQAINIMQYFAQRDPQANRLFFILTSFRDVTVCQRASRAERLVNSNDPPGERVGSMQPKPLNFNPDCADPIASIFRDSLPCCKRESSFTKYTQDEAVSFNIPRKCSIPNTSHAFIGDDFPGAHDPTDAFFNLARVTSQREEHVSGPSHDGNESLGEEIDFDSFWQWPTSTGFAAVMSNGRSVVGAASGQADLTCTIDDRVPLFGMMPGEFT